MVYQWENTQIVLDEGILEMLTMSLKSLEASKKLYAMDSSSVVNLRSLRNKAKNKIGPF